MNRIKYKLKIYADEHISLLMLEYLPYSNKDQVYDWLYEGGSVIGPS